MKRLLRSIVINVAALSVAITYIPGAKNSDGLTALVYATLVLSIINILIKPFISLLLLPVNLVTLGAFRWVANVIVLFLLTLFINDLSINSFNFPGIEYQGFIIPEFSVSKLWSLILTSALISTTNSFLFWLSKGEK